MRRLDWDYYQGDYVNDSPAYEKVNQHLFSKVQKHVADNETLGAAAEPVLTIMRDVLIRAVYIEEYDEEYNQPSKTA